MNTIQQDDFKMRAEMQFVPPPDLWAVAAKELSGLDYAKFCAVFESKSPGFLNTARYVEFVEMLRKEKQQ